jgi:acetoacetyl-CoA reductase
MSRVAVVSGGSRGIGAAIKGLQSGGHKVAATYAGNDEAANAKTETGIPHKWDVLTPKPRAALKSGGRSWSDRNPRQQCRITRDAMFHKMTAQQWNEVIGTNLTVSSI